MCGESWVARQRPQRRRGRATVPPVDPAARVRVREAQAAAFAGRAAGEGPIMPRYRTQALTAPGAAARSTRRRPGRAAGPRRCALRAPARPGCQPRPGCRPPAQLRQLHLRQLHRLQPGPAHRYAAIRRHSSERDAGPYRQDSTMCGERELLRRHQHDHQVPAERRPSA